jgi:hypothetical protein
VSIVAAACDPATPERLRGELVWTDERQTLTLCDSKTVL